MCIIYSSYIQHLTNKHKERQTTEKSTVGSEAQQRWELLSASGFLCLLHTLVKLLVEMASVALPRVAAPVWRNGSEQAGERVHKHCRCTAHKWSLSCSLERQAVT